MKIDIEISPRDRSSFANAYSKSVRSAHGIVRMETADNDADASIAPGFESMSRAELEQQAYELARALQAAVDLLPLADRLGLERDLIAARATSTTASLAEVLPFPAMSG